MFVAIAIAFPVVLLLVVLGMERVESRLDQPRGGPPTEGS